MGFLTPWGSASTRAQWWMACPRSHSIMVPFRHHCCSACGPGGDDALKSLSHSGHGKGMWLRPQQL